MNNYPYPVLAPLDSGYNEEIKFELNCTKQMIGKKELECELSYVLSSVFLKNLIEDEKAELYVKVKTSVVTKMYKCLSNRISINYEDIAESDTIGITLYIVAKENCIIKNNSELNEIYGDDYEYALRPNDILAISNTEELIYNLNGNDFIKFFASEEQNGKGIKIDCDGSNYIRIVIGTEFNTAYVNVKGDIELRNIINTNLVFECFVYILIEIAQNKDEYHENDWYTALDQLMGTLDVGDTNMDIETFIDIANDGDRINMEYIFKIAQELINNELENSMIKIGGKEYK